ncbi:MAG: hypothetical protein JW795_17860 [Chitinivibrionales bacterium]|nr:hypothetical protein [Chitinivibrionales bacterium]
MSKRIIAAALILFCYASLALSRIVIMVDANYMYSSVPSEIRTYWMAQAINDHGKTAKIKVWYGGDQFDVWNELKSQFNQALDADDYLEGVVLLGNIAPTYFYKAGEGYIPCDYFYMDLWDDNAAQCYFNWDDPWSPYGSGPAIDRGSYGSKGIGDGKLDLWVSRIDASKLNYLRDDKVAWGNFLEEYQIIERYIDRVCERMTQPAKVPRRGFAMGPPPGGYGSLQQHCALDRLGLNEILYFLPNVMNLNQAASWQAQLQNGPKGNKNFGARNGSPFTSSLYERSCITSAQNTDGYEWAAVYAHSKPELNSFHTYNASGCYNVGGKFRNRYDFPAWQRVEQGGFDNGEYYRYDEEYPHAYEGSAIAEWSWVIPKGKTGNFEVWMFWNYQDNNSSTSFYNLFGDKNFSIKSEGSLNQRTSGDAGWNMISSVYGESLDTMILRFSPNFLGYSQQQNRCIADAVQFRLSSFDQWSEYAGTYQSGFYVAYKGANYRCIKTHTASLWRKPTDTRYWQKDNTNHTITIKPSNLFDINKRGNSGFRCMNWYERSFYDMQDDGGQSKVPFFEIMGCEATNYLGDDNIAMLYALGHNGLTCIGNSSILYINFYYTTYTSHLNEGWNFGDAYLAAAQEFYWDEDVNMHLFGAGFIVSTPYQAYNP